MNLIITNFMKIMLFVRNRFVSQTKKHTHTHRCTQNINESDLFSVVGKVLRTISFYCHLGEIVCAFVLYVELNLFLVSVN